MIEHVTDSMLVSTYVCVLGVVFSSWWAWWAFVSIGAPTWAMPYGIVGLVISALGIVANAAAYWCDTRS